MRVCHCAVSSGSDLSDGYGFWCNLMQLLRSHVIIIIVWAMTCAGCGIGSDEPEPTKSGPPATQDPLALNVVQIEFQNLSSVAVDTQFYAAEATSNGLPDGLFVPENLIRTEIGNAATGILSAGESDRIAYPCSDTLAIGTVGGEFLDPNLGSPLGQGPIRFAQSRYQFDCGATLIFEYNHTTGGYTTHIFEER